MVKGASPGPAPACHARASNSRLTRSSWRTWPQLKLRRKAPRVDGALTSATENTGRPTGSQRIGVVDAVATGQRGSHQRQHLVPRVRPARRAAKVKVMVDEFPQAKALGEGGPAAAGRHWPPSGGRQRLCGYGRDCSVVASIGCSLFPGGFLFQNHYPRFRGAPSGFFRRPLTCPSSVDWGLTSTLIGFYPGGFGQSFSVFSNHTVPLC